MKTYNKLVRDKIPQICEKAGARPTFHRIKDDEEYLQALVNKLREEIFEFEESLSIEELADVLEIVLAICEHQGDTHERLEQLRRKKAADRGGFKKRIFLESTT